MSKVNSVSFRLGVQRGWDSIWHADKSSFGFLLQQDLLVREYVKGCILKSRYNLIVNEVLVKHTVKLSWIHIFLLRRPTIASRRIIRKRNLNKRISHKRSLRKSSLVKFTTFLKPNIARILQAPKESIRICLHLKKKQELRLDIKMMAHSLRFLSIHQKQKRLTGRRRKTFLNKFNYKKNKKGWRIRSLNGWFYSLLRNKFKKIVNSKSYVRGLCFRWTGRMSRGARSRTFVVKRGFIPYQTIMRPVEYSDSFLITKFGLAHIEMWVYRTRQSVNAKFSTSSC